MNEQEVKQAVGDYKARYERELQSVGFLGYSGEKYRLPRDTCYISRGITSGPSHYKSLQPTIQSELTPDIATAEERVVEQILSGSKRRMFLSGDGGMGKTEYARMLAYRLAESLNAEAPRSVPVLFELRYLTRSYDNGMEFFERRIAPNALGWLHPLAERGQVVFILDGLDEVTIDRRDRDMILIGLVERYSDCVFVMGGRPGSLGRLEKIFDEGTGQHLKPLDTPLIVRYVRGLFEHYHLNGEADQLVHEIQINKDGILPLVVSPFLLAQLCDLYINDKKWTQLDGPKSTAWIVEMSLRRLFARRRLEGRDAQVFLPESDAICLNALSTLAAFSTVTRPWADGSPQPFSEEDGEAWLLQSRDQMVGEGLSLEDDGDAKKLLRRLTPHSGVLCRTHLDTIAFTNRLYADHLAARWIVRYGYPEWPYGREGTGYTSIVSRTERQILDFLGDHFFTRDKPSLVLAVFWELSQTAAGTATLMGFIRWGFKQCFRYFERPGNIITTMFLAFHTLRGPFAAANWHEIEELAHRGLPPELPWWNGLDSIQLVMCIPEACKGGYRTSLEAAMARRESNLITDWQEIEGMVVATATNFGGVEDLMRKARLLLDALLTEARGDKKNGSLITQSFLRKATATGFAGDAVLCRRTFDELEQSLADAVNTQVTINDIYLLASAAICAASKGYGRFIAPARAVIAKGLRMCVEEPRDKSVVTSLLARLVRSAYPDDAELVKISRTAFESVAYSASERGHENPGALMDICGFVERAFPDDVRLKMRLASALATALSGHFMVVTGASERWRPKIEFLSKAIAMGIFGGSEEKKECRAVFTDVFERAIEYPEAMYGVIQMTAVAARVGFRQDTVLSGKAVNALIATLNRITGPNPDNLSAMNSLSQSILAHFDDSAGANEHAFTSLSAVVSGQLPSPEYAHVKVSAARTLASKFAGMLRTAVLLVRTGNFHVLNEAVEWQSSLILWGKYENLVEWAGLRGERWELGFGEPIIEKILNDSEGVDSSVAILVAPREKIRRALSAELLQETKGFAPVSPMDEKEKILAPPIMQRQRAILRFILDVEKSGDLEWVKMGAIIKGLEPHLQGSTGRAKISRKPILKDVKAMCDLKLMESDSAGSATRYRLTENGKIAARTKSH